MEEVDKVIRRPIFTKANKVTVAIKTNCIAIEDSRSRVGKLHRIMNSQHLETGAVAIVPGQNPGALTFQGLADAAAQYTHLIEHTVLIAQ
jgi:hypothetical protein